MGTQVEHQPYQALAFHFQLLAVVVAVDIQDGAALDLLQELVQTELTMADTRTAVHLLTAVQTEAKAVLTLEAEAE
jgi:hypothetical protein